MAGSLKNPSREGKEESFSLQGCDLPNSWQPTPAPLRRKGNFHPLVARSPHGQQLRQRKRLLLSNRFVEVEYQAGNARVGSQFAHIEFFIDRRLSLSQKLHRCLRIPVV